MRINGHIKNLLKKTLSVVSLCFFLTLSLFILQGIQDEATAGGPKSLNRNRLNFSTNFHKHVTESPQLKPKYVAGELIIHSKSGVNLEETFSKNQKTKPAKAKVAALQSLQKLHNQYKVTKIKRLHKKFKKAKSSKEPESGQSYRLSVPQDIPMEEIVAAYSNDPNVEYAEPNYIYEILLLPNDPFYYSSGAWGQAYDDLWGLKKINAEPAWDITQGEGVVVAVIDTGLDYNHEEISGKMWINDQESIGDKNNDGFPGVAGVDDDGDGRIDEDSQDLQPGESGFSNDFKDDDDENGYVDDINGWDFTVNEQITSSGSIPKSEDNDPSDGHGHGTHVSGTIAAKGNNGIGIIGVAPQARIMAIKGLNDYGQATSEELSNAIIYAADMGADVINASWGGLGFSQKLKDAVDYAKASGTIFVASAGNFGTNLVDLYPASFDSAISVAATNQFDAKCDFSNYGNKVDISAPGGGEGWSDPYNILSLLAHGSDFSTNADYSDFIINGQYMRLAGTSMAAPHVVGVLSLILSHKPQLEYDQILTQLTKSADNIEIKNKSFPGELGSGRINALRALQDPQPNIAMIDVEIIDTVGNGNGAADPGETVSLIVTLKNQWKSAEHVSLQLSTQNAFIDITQPVSEFGSINETEVKTNASEPLVFSISSDSPFSFGTFSYTVDFDIEITADNQSKHISLPIAISQLAVVPLKPWPIPWQGRFFSVTHSLPADINDDGFDDLMYYTNSLNKGGLIYDAIEAFDHHNAETLEGQWPILFLRVGEKPPIHVSVGDLLPEVAGDEIVYATQSGEVYISKKDGVPQWITRFSRSASILFPFEGMPVLADMDLDGQLEIIFLRNGFRGKNIFVTHADGTILNEWANAVVFHARDSLPTVANIDSDPQLELVIFDMSGFMQAFNHDGTKINLAENNAFVGAKTSVAADIDKDAKDEIIAIYDREKVVAIDSDGSILWEFQPDSDNVATSFSFPAVGDVNQDGELEIVSISLATIDGQTKGVMHILNSHGEVLPGWPVIINEPIEFQPVIGDLDADGDQEIVITSVLTNPHTYVFHHNDQDGDGFADPVSGWPVKIFNALSGFLVQDINAVSDINKDKNLDIIINGNVFTSFSNTSGIIPTMEFPMFRGNAYHNGRYTYKPPTLTLITPDVDQNGVIDQSDLDIVKSKFNSVEGDENYAVNCDMNFDKVINILDVQTVANRLNTKYPAVYPGKTIVFKVFSEYSVANALSLEAFTGQGDDLETIGADFTDHGDGTGTFTWQTAPEQSGQFNITFRVRGGSEPVSKAISIHVGTDIFLYFFHGTTLHFNPATGLTRLAGVNVELYKNGQLLQSMVTDGNGHYQSQLLETGEYTIIPSMADYTFMSTFNGQGQVDYTIQEGSFIPPIDFWAF